MESIAELEEKLKKAREQEYYEANKQRIAYENLKNETVENLCEKALLLSKELKEFQEKSFQEMLALFEVLIEYSKKHANGRGNFRVAHKDFRVSYKKQGRPTFDERSIIAEECIKEFVASKFEDDIEARDLIVSLLERRNGEFDINLIQKLYKMKDRFQDENWIKGINLLQESYTYEISKDYITFEKRNSQGKWETINLNFSSL